MRSSELISPLPSLSKAANCVFNSATPDIVKAQICIIARGLMAGPILESYASGFVWFKMGYRYHVENPTSPLLVFFYSVRLQYNDI